MTLTVSGWLFLASAWSAIGALTAWTMYQVLFASERRKKKGRPPTHPGDGEPGTGDREKPG